METSGTGVYTTIPCSLPRLKYHHGVTPDGGRGHVINLHGRDVSDHLLLQHGAGGRHQVLREIPLHCFTVGGGAQAGTLDVLGRAHDGLHQSVGTKLDPQQFMNNLQGKDHGVGLG